MCRDNRGCDDPISGDIEIRWNKWISDLTNLESLRIPRCIRPTNQVKIIHEELHHFSDASTVGYGACAYLQLITEEGKVHFSLVIGKSRVAPTKITTIPKLELTAALLAVKMSIMPRRELKYNNASEYFWTDSQIVLSYVNNYARKFHVFVANRIQQIKEHSDPSSWRYVPTKDNPADLASRGVPVSMLSSSCWLKAPDFLWKKDLPQTSRANVTVSKDDPNVKATAMNILVDTEKHFHLSRLDRFSSWYTVQKAISICLNYKNILLSRIQHNTLSQDKELRDQLTSLQNLEDARITILKILQHDFFGSEISRLQNSSALPANSKLLKLDHFLDKNNILRVGGRIQCSSLDYMIRHPILLPRYGHITKLVIRHNHENTHHQGRGITSNRIRTDGYWIIDGSRAVSSYIFKCVVCRRSRGVPATQKMAPLPAVRLEEVPPFKHLGLLFWTVFGERRTSNHEEIWYADNLDGIKSCTYRSTFCMRLWPLSTEDHLQHKT